MADLEPWLIKNYEDIAKASTHADPFAVIAGNAENAGAADLAAWARKRAKDSGRAIVPVDATPTPKPVKR